MPTTAPLLSRPRRVRRPGKPTAHKTRYVRPRAGGGRQKSKNRKQPAQILLGIVFIVALVAFFDQASIQPAELLSVSDGDTLRVSLDGREVKVRLYGIDTPEYKQPYGSAASEALRGLVANREIEIKERDKDRYGRLVAIVYADGENVNRQLVESGYAWWYRDHATFNVPLALAEFSARRNDRGLWQDEDPTPPWEWRSKRR